MRINDEYSSPNFAPDVVPVEFCVLHYTAADLARTLEIFASRERGVTAHFVLDTDGTVYDLGGFLGGAIRRGAHAGVSRVELGGVVFEALNKISLGIEIVNRNGNLLAYTEAQYASLNELLHVLVSRFPALRRPGHILGHEHIAGFRGKCDPGLLFDWPRVLGELGLDVQPLHQRFVFTDDDRRFAEAYLASHGAEAWGELSAALEARIGARRRSE